MVILSVDDCFSILDSSKAWRNAQEFSKCIHLIIYSLWFDFPLVTCSFIFLINGLNLYTGIILHHKV